MIVKDLSDLFVFQGQFVQLTSHDGARQMLGYMDKHIHAGPFRLSIFFFPLIRRSLTDSFAVELHNQGLKVQGIEVTHISLLDRLKMKVKLEQKEMELAGHSTSEALALIRYTGLQSRL